jgi:malonyl-CoA/methylmalonyl-CoA synthetase
LCEAHPQPELAYVLEDADVSVVVAHPEFADKLRPLAAARQLPLILTSALYESPEGRLPDLSLARRAMMLYTSGTTGRPKGVVSTHGNIQAQATTLISAWGWTAEDYIINVLPLHHVHGIINILTCALWVGATCEIRSKFDAMEVWARLASGDLTLFMAVPTIYARSDLRADRGHDVDAFRYGHQRRRG